MTSMVREIQVQHSKINQKDVGLVHYFGPGATRASQDSDEVNSLNSTTPMSNTGTKSRIVPKFRALSFRMTVKADLSNAIDKGAHISNRMALERPLYVTLQIAFYDASWMMALWRARY
jgi:hypothetical protein